MLAINNIEKLKKNKDKSKMMQKKTILLNKKLKSKKKNNENDDFMLIITKKNHISLTNKYLNKKTNKGSVEFCTEVMLLKIKIRIQMLVSKI